MKLFLAVASTFAIVVADSIPTLGGYSGSFNFGESGYNTGGSNNGISGGYGAPAQGQGQAPAAAAPQGPQVMRHVSVHIAPEDPADSQARVIRVPGGQEKHVNIIFVKAPSNGADQKTEVILPEQDEQKNLIYVLVQKTDPAANLKITKPQPTKPSRPEVYFIRYKNAQQNGQGQTAGSGGYGGGDASAVPSAAYGSPSPAYGAP